MGQIAIYKISEGAYGVDLLQKLAYGIYQLLSKAIGVKLTNNEDRDEVEYLANYYYTKSLKIFQEFPRISL